ncbi:MAG TPA: fructose-bisphosphatase class III [Planctomycetota bacterium]|nr:fructose-bisphosphatase class III [Planctomycetota bacterium]
MSPTTVSPYLAALAQQYPTSHAAMARISSLRALLTLPSPTIHVASDVHGEHVKFRHVVNNASGSLRPRLARIFEGRLDEAAQGELLNLVYYPRETWRKLTAKDDSETARRALLRRVLPLAIEVIRDLARGYSLEQLKRILPDPFDELFLELIFARELERSSEFLDALTMPFLREGRDHELIRMTAHAVRDLSVGELIVAGDLGDRGPRIDKVIEHMMRQHACRITWGNHDASWMGACLGQPALIATVLRVSLRYRRLSQLEEGYGITMAPLEHLAATLYKDDPAERFACKGEGLRDALTMARMQKAAAILQFKLEGQTIARHPEWAMDDRALLKRLDLRAGTVDVDGKQHALLDTRLPSIDPADPHRLSPEEEKCLARIRQSFMTSSSLWKHMHFVTRHGAMWLRRDPALIFHGCVPVDESGEMLSLVVDGEARRGRALFDALERVVQRAFKDKREADLDHLWYLWTGPLSPCFGKDRMSTFETYFVADKAAHHENKNAYFKLIHEAGFCRRVLAEFGADPEHGLIVNGHVPVRPEKGEKPLKSGGNAVTIDGAFAAAYGDRGYSLVLDAARIYLAQHHHFASVDEAVVEGLDIIPSVSDIQVHERPRTVGDTEQGEELRAEIEVLEDLLRAYADNQVLERA